MALYPPKFKVCFRCSSLSFNLVFHHATFEFHNSTLLFTMRRLSFIIQHCCFLAVSLASSLLSFPTLFGHVILAKIIIKHHKKIFFERVSAVVKIRGKEAVRLMFCPHHTHSMISCNISRM